MRENVSSHARGRQRARGDTHAEAGKEEALQVRVLIVRDLQKTRRIIEHCAGRDLVCLERVGRNHDERSAGIDDTRGRLEDLRVRAICN